MRLLCQLYKQVINNVSSPTPPLKIIIYFHFIKYDVKPVLYKKLLIEFDTTDVL